MSDFIYSDINYRLNTINKDIKIDKDNQAIKNSIRNILTIRQGTLVTNPEFGCNLEELLFEGINGLTEALAEEIIHYAIEKWEPRIKLDSVYVSSNTDEGQLMIELEYTILQMKQQDSYRVYL